MSDGRGDTPRIGSCFAAMPDGRCDTCCICMCFEAMSVFASKPQQLQKTLTGGAIHLASVFVSMPCMHQGIRILIVLPCGENLEALEYTETERTASRTRCRSFARFFLSTSMSAAIHLSSSTPSSSLSSSWASWSAAAGGSGGLGAEWSPSSRLAIEASDRVLS